GLGAARAALGAAGELVGAARWRAGVGPAVRSGLRSRLGSGREVVDGRAARAAGVPAGAAREVAGVLAGRRSGGEVGGEVTALGGVGRGSAGGVGATLGPGL
ncbi:hypothetical protein BLA60_39360, partial [Actinophytocola xinjiangensis]